MRRPRSIRSAMNGKNYNTDTAQSYLLGSLPDEETLRYDELSIIDDGFSDFLRNVENDLVDSYVNGTLDAITSNKFESFYLTTPKRRQKVAFARTLYQRTDRDPTIEPTVVKASEIRFFEKLRLALRPATLAFGAVALLCLAGAIWFIRYRPIPAPTDVAVTQPENTAPNVNVPQDSVTEPAKSPGIVSPPANEPRLEKSSENRPEVRKTPVPEPTSNPVIASFVLTAPLRGTSKMKSLKVGANVNRAAFRLELEPADYKSYKVELLDQTKRVIWSAGNQRPKGGQTRYVSVIVPADKLKPHIYVFRISGIAPDGTAENIGDYAFRIVR